MATQAMNSGLVIVAGLFSMMAVLIGLSRVHVGAHYPSDVIAGWLLGVCVVVSVTVY